MRLVPVGVSQLGMKQTEGIRYVWQLSPKSPYVESAAFRTRAKIPVSHRDNAISAYTTSVSSGCALTAARVPCRFCRTGNSMRFSGHLSSEEIAMQNVFMVMSDIDNNADSTVSSNMREFAYMGQGEPGFSYPQLRQAIKITDKVMQKLDQQVFRHIVATCGIVEMVDALIYDLEEGFYDGTRVTFHYSLHATINRNSVMPINGIYEHQKIINRLPRIHDLTGEKPCVGVLLFKNFVAGADSDPCSTDIDEIDRIADLLDPSVCRISLCEFNPSDAIGRNDIVTQAEATALVNRLEDRGFQVKLFASFGRQEDTACGLLGGTEPDEFADQAFLQRYKNAKHYINSFCR